ncbi:hypothetical protein C8R43DRAFT_959228 [Mycena crocata]|nr:hypothetical protein C8R43DRAFT_959228 [Mycena crocata]
MRWAHPGLGFFLKRESLKCSFLAVPQYLKKRRWRRRRAEYQNLELSYLALCEYFLLTYRYGIEGKICKGQSHLEKRTRVQSIKLLCATIKEAVGGFLPDPKEQIQPKRVIRQVCRRWRHTADDETSLWTHLYVHNGTNMDEMRQSLALSKGRPLVLFLVVMEQPGEGKTEKYMDALVDTFADGFLRCKRLVLAIDSTEETYYLMDKLSNLSAPVLESIELGIQPDALYDQHESGTVSHLFRGQLPLLTSVSFQSTFVLWDPAHLYSNLTHLRLEDLTVDFHPTEGELYDMLRAARRLESLDLLGVACIPDDHILTSDPPKLPRLTHLKVGCPNEWTSLFISKLDIPSMHTLSVSFGNDRQFAVFTQRFFMLYRNVRSLTLMGLLADPHNIGLVIHATPNLQRLDISGTYIAVPILCTSTGSSAGSRLACHWTSRGAELDVPLSKSWYSPASPYPCDFYPAFLRSMRLVFLQT